MRGHSQRRVLMVGCGALGGAMLERLDHAAQITVLDPSPRAIVSKRVWRQSSELAGQSFDGIIVVTKSYDLQASLRSLKGRVRAPRMLLLQNGIFDLSEILPFFADTSIVRGVTTSAAGIAAGKSVFHYQGDFYLAAQGAEMNEAVRWFGYLLKDAGFKARLVTESSRIIWAKLIFSAVMNPLPVITGQGYDVLIKDRKIWDLVHQAVKEGKAVARALGVRLAFDPWKFIQRVERGDLSGIPHRGSIYQDMMKRRPTELEFITGALVREAHKMGVTTPALSLILQRARSAGA